MIQATGEIITKSYIFNLQIIDSVELLLSTIFLIRQLSLLATTLLLKNKQLKYNKSGQA